MFFAIQSSGRCVMVFSFLNDGYKSYIFQMESEMDNQLI